MSRDAVFVLRLRPAGARSRSTKATPAKAFVPSAAPSARRVPEWWFYPLLISLTLTAGVLAGLMRHAALNRTASLSVRSLPPEFQVLASEYARCVVASADWFVSTMPRTACRKATIDGSRGKGVDPAAATRLVDYLDQRFEQQLGPS